MKPRLTPLPYDELPEASRALVDADRAGGRDPAMNSVLAHHPDFFARYFRFYYPAHEQGVVETRVKELARLAIARLNACPT